MMKLFGFYISRMDWREEARKLCDMLNGAHIRENFYRDLVKKYKRPRDAQGRFISKKDLMTEQLRAEVEKLYDWEKIKGARR